MSVAVSIMTVPFDKERHKVVCNDLFAEREKINNNNKAAYMTEGYESWAAIRMTWCYLL